MQAKIDKLTLKKALRYTRFICKKIEDIEQHVKEQFYPTGSVNVVGLLRKEPINVVGLAYDPNEEETNVIIRTREGTYAIVTDHRGGVLVRLNILFLV